MDYFVYEIQSKKDWRIYVGMSQDIHRRLTEHNKGQVFSTKGFTPWILIFYENCGPDRKNARVREKYWKSGSGKEKLKKNYSVVAQR